MIKWFIDFANGNWEKQFNISWMSQVWYPRICNYDTAPKQYRLQVANKLEKSIEYFSTYKSISNFYNKQIENLREDFLNTSEEQHLQQSFIRYNDTQDKHRGKTTWRQLLPRLEKALING